MFSKSARHTLFCDGFVTLGNEFEPLQHKVDEIFNTYTSENLDKKDLFKNKYQNASDLIDDEQRDRIRKIIDSSSLEQYVSDVAGFAMDLSHIQLRFVKINKFSYMPLHRDVHSYNGNLVGPVPVPYKVIFYPKNISSVDCLRVIPRSHRRLFGQRLIDLAVNLLLGGLKPLSFGKTKAVLFETTILHHVPKIKNENSSARLILTFTPRAL